MIGRRPSDKTGLPEQLNALRAAADLADGRLDPEAVAFAHNVVDKSDERLRHGTTHTLVALLGATGAGKSSLANAIVGSRIAPTGVRRPTTSTTLASVWGSADVVAEAVPLLDWLEVEQRHLVGQHDELDGLVLLDVPDHDSVQVAHRLEMERIAEHCDLMVWVTDPEKYADAALHFYLKSLIGHDAVTVLVLNKADQLDPASLEVCRADLVRLAEQDGIQNPLVLTASATTGVGVEQVRDRLGTAVHDSDAMAARLQADIAVAASELERKNGAMTSATISERSARDLATSLVDATGIDAVTEAVAAGTRRDAKAVMGWPFTRWAGRLRPHPLGRVHLGTGTSGRSSLPAASAAQRLRAEGAVRSFVDDVSAELAPPWPQLLRSVGTPDEGILTDQLDRAVAEGVRSQTGRTPRWWSLIGGLQALLAVGAIVGAGWLTVLFVAAWFQIPDPPTPEWRGWPVPTLLFMTTSASGLLLAFIAGRAAGLSARRAAKRARATAVENIQDTTRALIIDPVQAELAGRDELVRLLKIAGADDRLVLDGLPFESGHNDGR